MQGKSRGLVGSTVKGKTTCGGADTPTSPQTLTAPVTRLFLISKIQTPRTSCKTRDLQNVSRAADPNNNGPVYTSQRMVD